MRAKSFEAMKKKEEKASLPVSLKACAEFHSL